MDGPRLYSYPQFLPVSLRDALCRQVETDPGEATAVQLAAAEGLAVTPHVRRVWEVDLPDALHDAVLDRLEAVRSDLMAHFEEVLTPCDAVAALRYPAGAFYRSHRDVGETRDGLGLSRRTVSVVVFLNSGAPVPGAAFTGGQLRFLEGPGSPEWPHDTVPQAGMLVAFPSAWLHEVRPIAQGIRCTLATWFLRPDESGS
jgi:predicted 2-oxoglutarate/Fe(II)-dependent dioxygenase YbiX